MSRWPHRRTLIVLAGLPTVRFDCFNVLCSLIEAKEYPVGLIGEKLYEKEIIFCINCVRLSTGWVQC